ncbi:MAG: GAF domain-containing protein [Pseudomonadota bacterium]
MVRDKGKQEVLPIHDDPKGEFLKRTELLETEGALIILLDTERNELFFQGAAYDDKTKQGRVKEIRFPADKGVSGRVLRTGKEAIVLDTSKDPDFYSVVDHELGFNTRNMLTVPLRGPTGI